MGGNLPNDINMNINITPGKLLMPPICGKDVLYISDTISSTSFPQIGGINNLPGVIFIFIFISLGRLPPLLGFLGKLIILKRVILIIGLPLFLLTVFTSLIILYTYMSRFFYYIRFSPA